jgi:hypothetical protein
MPIKTDTGCTVRQRSAGFDIRAECLGLPQLVAIDDCALSARHVIENAALDKRVYPGVAEWDQRRTIVIAARIARDLPSLREQLVESP